MIKTILDLFSFLEIIFGKGILSYFQINEMQYLLSFLHNEGKLHFNKIKFQSYSLIKFKLGSL